MKLLEIFFNFLLVIFSFFVKKEKGVYLLGARNGKVFSENSKYLYLYANKIRKNSNFIWFSKDRSLYSKLLSMNLPVVYAYSFRGFWKILKSEKLIISAGPADVSYYKHLLGRFHIVQLWHGNPIKSINFLGKNSKWITRLLLKAQHNMYDFVLHTSDKTKAACKKSFSGAEIKILGYPRNDFRNKAMKDFFSFYDTGFLNKSKKVYLYCPTFRDSKEVEVSFSKDFLKKIDKLMNEKNGQFIIKNHKCLNIIEDEYKNIIDVSNKKIDIQELLIKTDVLISDYSSVVFDFSLLDRPIIFYPFDYDEYIKKCRAIELDYYKEIIGPFAKDEKELFKLINNVEEWSSKKDYKIKYKKFKKRFNKYLDGNSSERVYSEIKKNF